MRSGSQVPRSKKHAFSALLLLAACAFGLLHVQSIDFSMLPKDVDSVPDATALRNEVGKLLKRAMRKTDIQYHEFQSTIKDKRWLMQVELACIEGNPWRLGTPCPTKKEARATAARAMRLLMKEQFVVKPDPVQVVAKPDQVQVVAKPDLVVGQEVTCTIKRDFRSGRYSIALLGDNQTAYLPLIERQDGLPPRKWKSLKGAVLPARVLSVDGRGKTKGIFLTLRSGDLARPKLEIPPRNASLELFADLPPDQWLEGQVSGLYKTWTAFVIVALPNGGETAVGFLNDEDMTPGFSDEVGYGSPVKVRVKAVCLENGTMTLSMRDPEPLQESEPASVPESKATPEAAQELANEDAANSEP